MPDKKYLFYIERPIFFKKYEQISIEANSDEEALKLCKDEHSWDHSDIVDYYEVPEIGEPEITERHILQEEEDF